MTDPQKQDREGTRTPRAVPRDLPDQQARDGEDPLDETGARMPGRRERKPAADEESVPDEPTG